MSFSSVRVLQQCIMLSLKIGIHCDTESNTKSMYMFQWQSYIWLPRHEFGLSCINTDSLNEDLKHRISFTWSIFKLACIIYTSSELNPILKWKWVWLVKLSQPFCFWNIPELLDLSKAYISKILSQLSFWHTWMLIIMYFF